MEEQEDNAARSAIWRARFISLAEAVCRLRGQSAVAVIDDPDNYLSLEVSVEGQNFEILHFPEDHERLVVHCRVSRAQSLDILKSSLATNLQLARLHAGMFTLDPDTETLVYSTFQSLRGLTAEQLLQDLSTLPAVIAPWLQRFE